MTEPLLSVRDLRMSIEIPDSAEVRDILLGVSVDVAAGEAVALVGESGSGKSMTVRSVMRLLPEGAHISGEIVFRGESVLEMDRRRLRGYRANDVSIIFQDPAAHLDPTRTIGDFLIETIRTCSPASRKEAQTRAIRLLDDVRITSPVQRMRQYPHELSGGMLQRVMVASALAPGPSLLLADEPTTALDVTVQAEVMRIIGELRRERHLALLFITHDLELAEVSCDRMAVMYAGRVVEQHTSTDLTVDATHPYTIGLVRSRPSLASRVGRLHQLAGRPLSAHEAPPGCAFSTRCELAADRCKQDPPPGLRTVGSSAAACHRAEESRGLLGPVLDEQADLPAPRSAVDEAGPPIVEVRNLHRTFGSGTVFKRAPVPAVDDVSFVVRRGESLAVVGESGSGKTTLARLLVGLDRATSGTISIGGQERTGRKLGSLSRVEAARKIQIVFQDPYASLDPRQTIGSSIREALRRSAKGSVDLDDRAAQVMDRVGLAESLLGRYPRRLSGGQRQRVAIARALALDPEVLVLDEAVASLDVSIQAQVLNLLADLRHEITVTYVFITHDLAVVRHVADRVLVMRHGKVVELGDVDQVLDAPEADYTRTLISSVPSRMLTNT